MKRATMLVFGLLALGMIAATAVPPTSQPTPRASMPDRHGEKLPPNTGKQEHQDRNHPAPSIKTPPTQKGDNKADHETSETKKHICKILLRLERWWPPDPQNIFSFFLVLVGAGQIYVVWRTVSAVERPWVTFRVDKVAGIGDLVELRESTPLPVPRGTLIKLRVDYAWINTGRTNAFGMEGCVDFVCVDPRTLPAKPTYRKDRSFPEFLIPPKTPVRLAPRYLFMAEEQITNFIKGDAVLVIFGFIKYRRALGRKRETRFCLYCRAPTFWMGQPLGFQFEGPSKDYNGYT